METEATVRIDGKLASDADSRILLEILRERGVTIRPVVNHYSLDYALAQAREKGWMQ